MGRDGGNVTKMHGWVERQEYGREELDDLHLLVRGRPKGPPKAPAVGDLGRFHSSIFRAL